MSELKFERMSLFDAPEGSLIVHGCNAKGVWGSGIAAEFKNLYPHAFKVYNDYCNSKSSPIGTFDRCFNPSKGEKHQIGWLITSEGYGNTKSPEDEILVYTGLAIKQCLDYCTKLSKLNDNQPVEVYSNKFNSGLFGVPWEKTEHIIKIILKKYTNITWIVCTLDI